MKIGVLGAGFTGLSAAFFLSKLGHAVTIFEKDEKPGGLAVGFLEKNWDWTLEKHYHHFFTNDSSALSLAHQLNIDILINRPKTSVFLENKIYQLDSPLNVLTFSKLNLFDRLRMATVLGILKYNPFWKPLENTRASEFLSKTMGKTAYQTIWEPQLVNKFQNFADDISLAWFWARIRKRTSKLAYPKGGFLNFAQTIVRAVEQKGGEFLFKAEVTELKSQEKVVANYTLNAKRYALDFDKVIVTFPSFAFIKLAPSLPSSYVKKLSELKGLGAINLVLRLKKPFLTDGTYWLSVCEQNSPVMAVVEHTNFMNKKFYNNEHIVYLGNYLPFNHPYMNMNAAELLKVYDPLLRKINPLYHSSLITHHLFKVPFAQPIIPVNYSHIMPPFETPLKNVFLANIQQVYPWDRGTNYAIELGEKIAKKVDF